MNLTIELVVTGSTDKTIRCVMYVSGQPAGELQLSREDFTKVAERLFEGPFTVQAKPKTAVPPQSSGAK